MQHVTHTHTLPSFKHHTHYSKVSSTTRTPPRSQAPHALHQGFKYHTHSTKVSSTTRTPPRSQAPHALHQGLKHHTHSTKVSSTTQYYHDVLKAGCCGLTITARKRRKARQETMLTLVLAAGRPHSNFLRFLIGFLLPPVDLRLCQPSRVIPNIDTNKHLRNSYEKRIHDSDNKISYVNGPRNLKQT